MQQTLPELSVELRVVADIVPYTFKADDTDPEGLDRGYVQLRVSGDIVSLDVPPDVSKKMKEGERWYVIGTGQVRKKANRLHINNPTLLKRLSAAPQRSDIKVEFDLDKPAKA